jgi:hypothetical protein
MVSFRFFTLRKVDKTNTQQAPKVEQQDGAGGPSGSDKMFVISYLP